MRNSTTLLAAALVSAVALSGCFGSRFEAEGRHDLAGRVRIQDSIGVGLLGTSAWLLYEAHELAEEEDRTGSLLVGIGAAAIGGIGIGVIASAETLYPRTKKFERRRAEDPERLRKLRKEKAAGWLLLGAGVALANLTPWEQDEEQPLPDETNDDESTTLEVVGGVTTLALIVSGMVIVCKNKFSDRRWKSKSHSLELFVLPNSAAIVYRF